MKKPLPFEIMQQAAASTDGPLSDLLQAFSYKWDGYSVFTETFGPATLEKNLVAPTDVLALTLARHILAENGVEA